MAETLSFNPDISPENGVYSQETVNADQAAIVDLEQQFTGEQPLLVDVLGESLADMPQPENELRGKTGTNMSTVGPHEENEGK